MSKDPSGKVFVRVRRNSSHGQEEQILYSAITFRCLLDSLARPGKVNRLEHPSFLGEPPRYRASSDTTAIPLNLYALGALLTLLDREVSFVMAADGRWLDSNAPAVQWLALRSGAGVTVPGSADFAFFCFGASNGLLAELHVGTLLEPESSATTIYCVECLGELGPPYLEDKFDEPERPLGSPLHVGAGFPPALSVSTDTLMEETMILELAGPGIQKSQGISVLGLDKGEIELIRATRRNYPLGIDIYLVDAEGRCAGLPRTTRL